MSDEGTFRFQDFTMDILDSMSYDKEQFLDAMIEASGMSVEVFSRDWILDEYPIEIIRTDNLLRNDYAFKIEQKFRIRLKTAEEHQLELERNKEKNDVDPNNA